MTPSPPPAYNFATIPTVRSRRPLWDLAHPEAPDWRYERHESRQAVIGPRLAANGSESTGSAGPLQTRRRSARRRRRPRASRGCRARSAERFEMTPARMLMLFFISSESIFFISLIVMYSVVRVPLLLAAARDPAHLLVQPRAVCQLAGP